MRFLLFNVVVAAALVFLFASDRAELHAVADRAHAAATDLKTKAFEVIGARNGPAERQRPEPVAKPKAGQKAAAAAIPDKPAAPVQPAVPPHPGAAAAAVVKEIQVATRKLVPPLPPEVAKRREEVLAEGVIGGKVSGVGNADRAKFMTASDRKRDLMLLSEEMEMFSARSIGRE